MGTGPSGSREESHYAPETLLSHCLGVERGHLLDRLDEEVDHDISREYLTLLGRHHVGEPVAYLIGHKDFCGLDFHVDNRVLVPRPETENIVNEVVLRAGEHEEPRILDVGTGSGCIAISLAKKLPRSKVTAADISPDALDVARVNTFAHGVEGRVDLVQSDLIADVPGEFDFVVANLPYIKTENAPIGQEAVHFEPSLALFGGSDGLSLYEKLFRQLQGKVWKPRFLLGEFGFLQGNEIRSLSEKYFGGGTCRIIEDYASMERVFVVGFAGHE